MNKKFAEMTEGKSDHCCYMKRRMLTGRKQMFLDGQVSRTAQFDYMDKRYAR